VAAPRRPGGRDRAGAGARGGRSPALNLAILSEEDHPDAESVAARFIARGALVAVTRGARGATLQATAAGRWEIPPAPAVEIDPTGAGDVFGVVLALGLASGKAPADAGADAAWAAARVIEGPGLGRLIAAGPRP
jgi:1D-myo-inositol 3-kinase